MNKETKNNFVWRRVKKRKYDAKKKSIEFDIDYDFALNTRPRFCPILGYELDWSDPDWRNLNVPCLLRIDPSLGFFKENMIWVSRKAFLCQIGIHGFNAKVHDKFLALKDKLHNELDL